MGLLKFPRTLKQILTAPLFLKILHRYLIMIKKIVSGKLDLYLATNVYYLLLFVYAAAVVHRNQAGRPD